MTIKRFTAALCLFKALIFCAIAVPVDSNFAVDSIQSGNGKTKVAFDAVGRMYVAEKQGRVLLFDPNGSGGFQAPSVLLDITASVDPNQESGLLGFEIDPDHSNNRFIYLFYTTTTDQRLVRYTMNPTFDGIENGSTLVLLSGLPRNVNFHKAGDIGIHPLDPFAIFIMLGDDGQAWPDPVISQNLDSYVGKILRIDTSTGLGLSDNPYYNGTADTVSSRVWASGCRNPFRFVFHPDRSDILYVSENGDGTDRVAMVKAGGNGLWNGNDNGGFLTVNSPLFKVLHTDTPSLLGIEIVTSGPLAHNAQPTLYVGNWMSGIRRFTLSDSTNPQGEEWDTTTPIPGGGANFWDDSATAMDLHLGADGHLYYTQTNGDDAQATWYPLRRYRFAGGTPPIASFAMTPADGQGEAPFLVTFTDSSTQGTHALSSWHWDFGDGESSMAQNSTHTYTNAGAYTATLTITDNVGLSDISQLQVEATTSTSVTLILNVQDGRTLPSIPATSVFTIALFQLDGAIPLPFTGGTGAAGNQLITLADGTYTGSLDLDLTGAAFVMKLAELASPGFQPVTRGVELSLGEATMVTETFFVSTSALSGRVLTQRGNPAVVDVGVTSGGAPFAFAGARDYLAGSHLPLTGITHRVSTDALGYFSIPITTGQEGATLDLTFAEDTNREIYVTGSLSIISQEDTDLDSSYTIGEWSGGPADDLSGQVYTPGVEFSTIQAIFSANCTGCHTATTSNNGGLDLTSGNSFNELVDQPSLFVPGLKLVEPGRSSVSYLFEKINSAAPQQGTRMRPTDAMSLADQALIRDWITQLAPSYENYVRTTLGVAPGSLGTGVDDDFDNDGVSNGMEQAGLPQLAALAASADGASFQGELRFAGASTGLTLFLQSSDDLKPGQWETVTSRLRGQSVWRVTPGFSVSESSPGILQFTDSTFEIKSRFYRFGVNEE